MKNQTAKSYAAKNARFRIFVQNLKSIYAMRPQSKYAHPLMETVPFQDLETAIDMVKERQKADAQNDNAKGQKAAP